MIRLNVECSYLLPLPPPPTHPLSLSLSLSLSLPYLPIPPSLPLSLFILFGPHVFSVLFNQTPHQRDLAALNDKVKTLSKECKRLCDTYPESSVHVNDKENDVLLVWEKLLGRSKARKDKLIEAEQLQRFLNNFRDLKYVL